MKIINIKHKKKKLFFVIMGCCLFFTTFNLNLYDLYGQNKTCLYTFAIQRHPPIPSGLGLKEGFDTIHHGAGPPTCDHGGFGASFFL